MYRMMVTNDIGEPLGYDYIYDDEPGYDDDEDFSPYDYDDEPGDFDTYPDTDLDQEYETGYEEYEPSPYDGTYSEE